MGEKGYILELNLTGKLYRANQQYLKAVAAPLDQIRMNAFKYWSGASGENPAENEYLFEGFVKVSRIVTLESIIDGECLVEDLGGINK